MRRESETAVVTEYSLSELAGIFQTPANPLLGEERTRSRCEMTHDPEWYGGLRSHAEARRILDNGWRAGADRLASMVNGIGIEIPAARGRKRNLLWRDMGDELSVDRAMRGDFDRAWRSSRRVMTRAPQNVTLMTRWGANCYTSAEELFWQGAATAVLTDALESAGYRVRVVAGTISQSSTSAYETRLVGLLVNVKDYDEPMRPDALAAIVCHAGIFRTYGFRAIAAGGHDVCASSSQPWTETDCVAGVRSTGLWPEADPATIELGTANTRDAAIAEIKRVLATIETQE